ncbi:MAG TPA: YdiU family protein [Kiritimatiellia bacterium]|nr:YdiU family protein [Kiritimatiellia bacterium]HMP00442.1 YdiU family protein [Kiritimatiellia bacterium]HMP97657.1 YdiU family protein [Kiritimatiellia bacterium]
MTVDHLNDAAPVPDGAWRFDHSYRQLPAVFFTPVAPTPVQNPRLALFNHALAIELGLDDAWLSRPGQAGLFTGNELPKGAYPIAQAYAGHQFGHFTNLGDGRAILLGEHLTPDHRRFDIQFKGTGPTPYSRRGDGRAALGPMLREYIISEAMHALGIPTTRSLAVATTGENVFRRTVQPGAVLTRVAASHIRVGTFEFAAAHHDPALLRALADYTIARHYPHLRETEQPYAGLLEAVVEGQASLIARWLLVGFVHGVMNTDNVALSGETIDYGPCAFMEAYDPATVFSSIDEHGRYAYGRQPPIGQWNLSRFAETLLPLLAADAGEAQTAAQSIINTFPDRFFRYWFDGMKAKLGLLTEESADRDLIDRLLALLAQHRVDYTNAFRALSAGKTPHPHPELQAWFEAWTQRIARQPLDQPEILAGMRRLNPAVIPRNHRVEEALQAAEASGDYLPLERLLEAVTTPFEHDTDRPEYQTPAPPDAPPYRTFCGT